MFDLGLGIRPNDWVVQNYPSAHFAAQEVPPAT